MLYILFHLWNIGCFVVSDSSTIIISNGEIVKTGMITSGLTSGLINMLLTAGGVLSWIGIICSMKKLKRERGDCHSEQSEESQL